MAEADEIQGAFRRRLTENPPAPDLRARVAAAAEAGARPSTSLSWVPALAVMIGLLLVAGVTAYLMQFRHAVTNQPLGSPAPSSSAARSVPLGFSSVFGWDGVGHRIMVSDAVHDNRSDPRTWALSGNGWTEVPGPAYARTLVGGVLVYDSRLGREVLAAISYGAMETWEWDGHQWKRRATTHVPDVHSQNASGAYDPQTGRTVILDTGTVAVIGLGTPTWVYDGTDWRSITTSHQPDWPAHLEYDQARHSIVALSLKDFRTWIFDGRDWTALPLSGPTPTVTGMPGRQAPWVGLDQQRHLWVVFGGSDGVSRLTDTWTGDGNTWTRQAPASSPSSRVGVPGLANLAWEPQQHVLILFGGQASFDGPYLGDTWAWDGATWRKVAR